MEVYEELYKDLEPENIKDADVICFYTMTSNAPRAYELAKIFQKEYKKRVIIGGMHASAVPEEAIKYADQVVIGEAENIIVDVIEGNAKGKIVNSPPVEDLDSIPFPDYSILKTPCKVANLMTSEVALLNVYFALLLGYFIHRYRTQTM